MNMNQRQRSTLTKIFSLSGALLLAAPIAFMLLTAVVGSIAANRLLCDYLMLAEFFPIIGLGLALLILAGLLSKTFAKWFIWGSATALVTLVGGLIYASASGLSTGVVAQGSAASIVVTACIILYNLLVAALCALGFVLVSRVFRKKADESVVEA